SHQNILTEEIIKRRVREPVSAGMRNPLLDGKFFKNAAKCRSVQSVQRLLCGEHRLIVVCVKIPSNDEPVYRRDFRSDVVADMRHQLIYGNFLFSDILRRFCYRIAVCDEIAFQMNGINTNVRISNFEPRKSESPWWVDSFDGFPRFSPSSLCWDFCKNRFLLFPSFERRANCNLIRARLNCFSKSRARIVIAHLLK